MGITLSQIASNTASVTIQVGEDTVTVDYYPGRVTEKTLIQLQGFASLDASTLAAGFTAFNETLAHLIKSWDVLDDSVEPAVMFPLEARRLAELPVAFRVQIINTILRDIRPEMIASQTA